MRTPNSMPPAHAYSPLLLLATHAYIKTVALTFFCECINAWADNKRIWEEEVPVWVYAFWLWKPVEFPSVTLGYWTAWTLYFSLFLLETAFNATRKPVCNIRPSWPWVLDGYLFCPNGTVTINLLVSVVEIWNLLAHKNICEKVSNVIGVFGKSTKKYIPCYKLLYCTAVQIQKAQAAVQNHLQELTPGTIPVFTDGSALCNPGPCGAAAVLS